LSQILEKATLRILNQDGKTVGAGFLITPKLAVTCAHVVKAAKSEPGQLISVARARGEDKQIAQVLEKGWSADDQNDIAFLQLSKPSKVLSPVRLSTSQNRVSRFFTSLGFPENPNYYWDMPKGLLGGIIPSTVKGREDLLQFPGNEIRQGMSGGAVLDNQAKQVVGMICEFEISQGVRNAYAITAETICKFAPEKIILDPPDKIRRQWIILGTVLGISLILALLFIFTRPPQLGTMTGDFNVAVAGFAVTGNPEENEIGTTLAENVFLHLNENLNEIAPELKQDISQFKIQVWAPEKIGGIRGNNREERADAARKLAQQIHADIIIYGVVDTTQSTWKVTPEFYLYDRSFYEAQEITGQHDMGTPFSIPGQNNTATRIAFSNQISARTKVLSVMAVGLSFYAENQLKSALSVLQTAENAENFGKEQGKEILYLLLGNTAAKLSQFPEAEQYYQKSLAIDPEYARAQIGMGSVNYIKALTPFQLSLKPGDIDNNLIDTSIKWYQNALQARNIPALANVETKVHFGLGQCYLLKVYSEKEQWFDPAIAEFQAVVQEYGNGKNIYVKELAAEAHARLGLIYALSGDPKAAIQEYEEAVKLLDEYPDRKNMYLERITKLREKLNP
jgi:tetratricopeptide (TPR) repeat protein